MKHLVETENADKNATLQMLLSVDMNKEIILGIEDGDFLTP